MAANKTVQDDEIREILNELFPVTDKTSEREKATIDKIKDEFMICYFAPDIRRFPGDCLGCDQRYQRSCDTQYAPPEYENLSGKYLEQGNERPCPVGQDGRSLHEIKEGTHYARNPESIYQRA